MISIRKSTLFIGLLVVSTLILLNSCEKCGKKNANNPQDDKKAELKTEAQHLVDKLSSALELKDAQKNNLKSLLVETFPAESNIKTWLPELQSLQAKLKVTGGNEPLSDVNKGIKLVISDARDVKDLLEASEVLDILINLLKNAKERAKLEAESKK